MKHLLAGDACYIKRKYYDERIYINVLTIIIIIGNYPPPMDVSFRYRIQIMEASIPLQGIVGQVIEECTTVAVGDIDSD